MFRCTLFSLCIAVGVLHLGRCADNPAGKNVQNQTLAVVERIWMSQVFDQARQQFDITANQSTQCRRDYDLYQLHSRNQSIWAIRMLEASEWPEIGIFAGMTYHMGNWAECVNIKSYGITGQFCMPKATYDYVPDKVNFTIEEVPAEESSAWTAMKMYLHNPVRVNRHEQYWAMCIPSSCTPADLEVSLNETVDAVFKKYGFNVTFDVDPVHCSTREVPVPYKITPIVKAFFIILILMLFGATTFDFIESRYKDVENDDNEPVMKEFISAFSIRKNTIQLFTSKPSDNPPIHFGKIIAMFFIIFGHLFLYSFSFPLYNPEYIENEYRKWNIALTRTSIVDLFFGISGILTCYHSLESVKKGGIVYLIASLIVRYLRMVPIFGVLMLFVIYFLPHMGNGPYWKDRILREVDHCSSSWWTNLLVVNNFVQPEKQCLIISWYIAVDIQLSIIGCILLYMVVKNRRLGWIMIGLVFFIGNAATFAVVYINKYYGLTRLFMSFQKEPRWHDEFNYFYIQPHPRIAPYIVGFATALLAFELRESKYKMSKTRSRVIFLLLLALSEGSQWYGIIFYKFGRKYDIYENSVYGALNRWLFLLPYAFICVQYFTTGIEPLIDKIINHKIYVPFGRLTYSVFLVNSVIELYLSSMQADLIASSTPANMWVWTVSAVFYSYFIGFVFYVCVEAPFVNQTKLLQRVILSAVLPKRKPQETATELPEKKQIEN